MKKSDIITLGQFADAMKRAYGEQVLRNADFFSFFVNLCQKDEYQLGSDAGDVMEAGGITIDKAAHIVKIDGKPIELSYKEFELLTYFVENRGIALSREKILNNVWNYDYFGDARTIDTHVKKLRSKLGDKGEYIRTIWGMGYKFDAE